MRVHSAAELEHFLRENRPESVEIEFRESDVSGQWGEFPEVMLGQVARQLGYETTKRRTGGKAPFFGWMGKSDRYVYFTIERQGQMRQPQASSDPSVTRFLRVWAATYQLDKESQTHVTKTVSGETREEAMAEAWRRAPEGAPVVYIAREDDLEPVWSEDNGFAPAADEPHQFESRAPQLFKDLAVGETFRRGYGFDQFFEKIDERHGRHPELGNVFEVDPYDGAY